MARTAFVAAATSGSTSSSLTPSSAAGESSASRSCGHGQPPPHRRRQVGRRRGRHHRLPPYPVFWNHPNAHPRQQPHHNASSPGAMPSSGGKACPYRRNPAHHHAETLF